ncbi:MAG: hypothetical protein ABI592_10085 [Acidobacteriota bacterium]
MATILCIWLCAVSASAPADPVPWHELALAIEEDRTTSSDHLTLCRVRVVNHGRSTWPGSRLGFEARAVRDGRIAARQTGRFGLTLAPHETLETIVGFVGRFDRFEVVPSESGSGSRGGSKGGSRSGKPRRGKTKKSGPS